MPPAPHDFVLVIPVADRPRQLADCLASLGELRRRHPYPGTISVVIADDSRDPAQSARIRTLCVEQTDAGLAVEYFGEDAQRALHASLPAALRQRLGGVIGDGTVWAHKGAAITRNLACLRLNRLPRDGRKRLFWFIDSDQSFDVGVGTDDYAIDYFGALDRIFRDTPTRILTGKVVGDPPVSPAVMAGTLLDDVLAFLDEMARQPMTGACTFHAAGRDAADAAYHDMPELFGFRASAPFRHACPLPGAHDHAACLARFAAGLDRFFDGEHPTRRNRYRADDPLASLAPARTLYTGNYVLAAAALDAFIPFAALRLRMAGPTLGRLLRAELGAAFVAANLPMRHRRSHAELGRAECRPGVERGGGRIDLGDEFERQLFGDVMLFSVERLAASLSGTAAAPSGDAMTAVVNEVEADMQARYAAKHAEIVAHLDRLDAAIAGMTGIASVAADDLRRFAANLRANFGDDADAWRRVNDPAQRTAQRGAIAQAIAGYADQRTAWREALQT